MKTPRQIHNENLVHILSKLVKENPDLRFSQILQSFGFVEYDDLGFNGGPVWTNEFNEEPVAILKRVEAKLASYKENKNV